MSESRYASPLHLQLGHSWRLRLLFPLFYLICAGSVLLAPLPFLFSLGVILLLFWHFRRQWQLQPVLGGCPLFLVWDGEGLWQSNEEETRWRLQGECLRLSWMVILNLANGHRRRHLLLPFDAVEEETFRRLRVRLYLEASRGNTHSPIA